LETGHTELRPICKSLDAGDGLSVGVKFLLDRILAEFLLVAEFAPTDQGDPADYFISFACKGSELLSCFVLRREG